MKLDSFQNLRMYLKTITKGDIYRDYQPDLFTSIHYLLLLFTGLEIMVFKSTANA